MPQMRQLSLQLRRRPLLGTKPLMAAFVTHLALQCSNVGRVDNEPDRINIPGRDGVRFTASSSAALRAATEVCPSLRPTLPRPLRAARETPKLAP